MAAPLADRHAIDQHRERRLRAQADFVAALAAHCCPCIALIDGCAGGGRRHVGVAVRRRGCRYRSLPPPHRHGHVVVDTLSMRPGEEHGAVDQEQVEPTEHPHDQTAKLLVIHQGQAPHARRVGIRRVQHPLRVGDK